MRHDYEFKFLIADDPPPYPTRIEDLDIPPNYDTKAAQAELDALTPEEKEKYEEGIARVIGDNNLKDSLKQSALAAATACKNIDNMFDTLTSTLVSLDLKYGEHFASGLGEVQKEYRGTVDDSRALALRIALYAERYEDVIIPFCADKDLTVEQRIKKIKEFIADGKDFETHSDNMKTRFEKLKKKFETFIGTFSTWAKDREDDDRECIRVLRKEIETLSDVIFGLTVALYALYAALTVQLPATGIAVAFAGPFAPLVMAGGCIIAGIELAAILGLLIAKMIKEGELDDKNKELKTLQEEIETIQATRAELEETGRKDVDIFKDNINVLAGVWVAARNDAQKVQYWLEEGAKDAKIPKYMALQLGKSVAVYKTMGAYLQDYAYGVIDIPQ